VSEGNQNTFYDREPRLDLTAVDFARWPAASYDFITSSDVLEHVAPPVERALVGMRELLKPGGVAVLTVPTSLAPDTVEHFPDLHEWRLHEDGNARVLVNRLPDGREQRFADLRFHGGEGLTLEFRVFSRSGLLRALEDAGFAIADVFDDAIRAHGIPLRKHEVVVVAERPRAGQANARAAAR
jgi:SAM-dependent methyltransferase